MIDLCCGKQFDASKTGVRCKDLMDSTKNNGHFDCPHNIDECSRRAEAEVYAVMKTPRNIPDQIDIGE